MRALLHRPLIMDTQPFASFQYIVFFCMSYPANELTSFTVTQLRCDTRAVYTNEKKTRPYSTVGIRIACIFTSDDIAIFHLRVLAFVFVFVFVFVVVSNALH